MSKYESAPVPFVVLSDGRRCLTDEQLVAEPHLAAFVTRFPRSFEYDPEWCIHVFVEPKD